MSILNIRKVEKTASLRERIRDSLSGAIVSGEIAPGSMLTVPALAGKFEVSATPVREAMLDLEQRGFVHSVANKGFRVSEVSRRDLQDLVEARQLLEAPIVAGLVGRIPPSDMGEWRSLADLIIEYADSGNLTGFVEADKNFHLGLLALHGNDRVVQLVKELRSQTRMVGLAQMTNSPQLSKSGREHHEILDLIEGGSGEALRDLLLSHLAHILDWWGPANEAPAERL